MEVTVQFHDDDDVGGGGGGGADGGKTGKYTNKSHYKGLCCSIVVVGLALGALVISIYTCVAVMNSEKHDSDSSFANRHRSLQQHSPAYAHKYLIGASDDTSTGNVRLLINHTSNDEKHEISWGVTLLPEGIQIDLPGSYFVFKSIFFMPYETKPCEELGYKDFSGMLVLKKEGTSHGTKSILRSVHTCCPTCRDITETAFTGGVFHLDKGDVIQMEVTAYDLVDLGKDVTYMGLMMIHAPT